MTRVPKTQSSRPRSPQESRQTPSKRLTSGRQTTDHKLFIARGGFKVLEETYRRLWSIVHGFTFNIYMKICQSRKHYQSADIISHVVIFLAIHDVAFIHPLGHPSPKPPASLPPPRSPRSSTARKASPYIYYEFTRSKYHT